MSAEKEESMSKEVPERTAEPWPYLHKAGLKLNLAELKKVREAVNFGSATNHRISEEITFTNGMMWELRKNLKEVFLLFKFVKSIVPYSIYKEQLECMEFSGLSYKILKNVSRRNERRKNNYLQHFSKRNTSLSQGRLIFFKKVLVSEH